MKFTLQSKRIKIMMFVLIINLTFFALPAVTANAATINGDLNVPDNLIIYDGGYYSLDGGGTMSTDTLGPDTQIKKASGSLTIELYNTAEVAVKRISVPDGNLIVTGSGALKTNNQNILEMSVISGIRVYNGGLTVSGGATLTSIGFSYGVYAPSDNGIVVSEGSILIGEATGTNDVITGPDKYGIHTYGGIQITDSGRLEGICTISHNTYGVYAYGGLNVSDGDAIGTGNVGIYSNRNGSIQVNSGGTITGTGGSYATSHGVQADSGNIIVNSGGILTGKCGGYAGVQASTNGITVNGGRLEGTTTGTGRNQYGVHVSGANPITVSDGGTISGTGFYNGVYNDAGNITATGSGTAEGFSYTYGTDGNGYFGAVVAGNGLISAGSNGQIVENYSMIENFDDTYTLPYRDGKNMDSYLNYGWSITSGTGTVTIDPSGGGIKATTAGSGTLTGTRTGNITDEIVVLDNTGTHTIHIPVELTVLDEELPEQPGLPEPPLTPYYTVTYDANGATGGSVPTDETQYLPDELVTVKNNEGDLHNADYTFAGWTLSPNGSGRVFRAGDTFPVTEGDVTLYAKWDGLNPENSRSSEEMPSIPHTGDQEYPLIFFALTLMFFALVAGLTLSYKKPGKMQRSRRK